MLLNPHALNSSICSVSLETSCKVVQVVCKNLHNHNVYLTPVEQLEGEQEIFNQENILKIRKPQSQQNNAKIISLFCLSYAR